MQTALALKTQKRRPVNLTIRQDILEEAKDLKLNASRVAEAGLIEAVRQEKERLWCRENAAAIEAHNTRVEEVGTLLTPTWAKR
jgi:antitoxin CcdA